MSIYDSERSEKEGFVMNTIIRQSAATLLFVTFVVHSCQAAEYIVTNNGNESIGISMNIDSRNCGTLKANLQPTQTVTLNLASVCSRGASRTSRVNRLKLWSGSTLQFDSNDFGICFSKDDLRRKIDITQSSTGQWGIRMYY